MRISKKALAAALGVATAAAAVPVAVPAGADEQATSSVTKSVSMRSERFRPARLEIRRNDIVVWRYSDGARHNVISTGTRRFRSGPSKTSGTHKVRFRRRGRYTYLCSFHLPTMKGVVIVR